MDCAMEEKRTKLDRVSDWWDAVDKGSVVYNKPKHVIHCDVCKMMEGHITFLKANKGNKRLTPYFERVWEVYKWNND